jgi:2-polyprenyl-3-methyl-5-hydroxy-6-metoxy-1,4-benzoquinol methylase
MTITAPGPGSSFDATARLYDDFTVAADRIDGGAFRRWLADQLPDRGLRALDVGCGAGRLTTVLADLFDQVVGIDPSPAQIELAGNLRPRHNIRYDVRGLFGIDPSTHGQFDAVVAAFAVHHAGDPDDTLPHLRELVAPGGKLVVVDVVDTGGWTDPAWQIQRAWATAQAFYSATRDPEAAATVIRLFLHPRWLEQCAEDVPLTVPGFDAAYSAALPGVRIASGLYGDGGVRAAVWAAPGG